MTSGLTGRPWFSFARGKRGLLIVLTAAVVGGAVNVQAGAAAYQPIAAAAGLPLNPVLEKFSDSIKFYLSFNHLPLMATLSTGAGAPASVRGPTTLKPGLYGRALLVAPKTTITYHAQGNVNLSQPGAMAVWVSPYRWQHLKKHVPFLFFLMISDHGRILVLARMGAAPNHQVLYAYAGVGNKVFSDVIYSASSLHWKTGQWHLLAVNWGADSIAFSVDGKTWQKMNVAATGFARAKGTPGVLQVAPFGCPVQQQCLLDELLVFNRPLSVKEIKWIYHQGREQLKRR